MNSVTHPSVAAVLIAHALAHSAPAAQWSDDFAPRGYLNSASRCAVFDDGTGTALFVGALHSAGPIVARGVAKWDGQRWRAFPSEVEGGWGPWVTDLAVFDSGSGPELYVGGGFNTIEGLYSPTVARWGDGAWSSTHELGVVLSGSRVHRMHVTDLGAGPRLYVSFALPVLIHGVSTVLASFDGVQWSSVGSGLLGDLYDLQTFDAGNGLELYAVGRLLDFGAGEHSVIRWNGTTWSPVASSVDLGIVAAEVFDDGSGEALYVAGDFTTIEGLTCASIARFDGAQWSSLGNLFAPFTPLWSLERFHDGSGQWLIIGGEFQYAGGVECNSVARWDGAQCSALGSPVPGVRGAGVAPGSAGVQSFDLGAGAALYASGSFHSAGGVGAERVAIWNGASWSGLGDGHGVQGQSNQAVGSVLSFGAFGGELYAGGDFETAGSAVSAHLARWDGQRWHAIPGAPDDEAHTLLGHDDGAGERLYVGGEHLTAGGQAIMKLARWDGSAWSAAQGGVSASGNVIHAQIEYDDGSGTALYAAGRFANIGGVNAKNIAKWDGTTWSRLGVNANFREVHALAVHDDGQGGGAQLYAGGGISAAAGQTVHNIARWNGTSWSSVGDGLTATVFALAVFDVGEGPDLIAAGQFTSSFAN